MTEGSDQCSASPESVLTMPGILAQLPSESVLTLDRNRCSACPRVRTEPRTVEDSPCRSASGSAARPTVQTSSPARPRPHSRCRTLVAVLRVHPAAQAPFGNSPGVLDASRTSRCTDGASAPRQSHPSSFENTGYDASGSSPRPARAFVNSPGVHRCVPSPRGDDVNLPARRVWGPLGDNVNLSARRVQRPRGTVAAFLHVSSPWRRHRTGPTPPISLSLSSP